MKPKFTELTDGEQARIIEGEYIRRETPSEAYREHMKRMIEHARRYKESQESLDAVLEEVPPDKEEK